jgi:predicted N-acetyltransferase YhbS
LWTPDEQLVSAAYIARLIVRRDRAGERIGEALIDWAGARGLRCWSAQWIRIDVWTTNDALHNYYEKRGFQHYKVCEFKEDEYYPSAALFQKPTAEVDLESAARFLEHTGLPVGMVPQVPLVSPGSEEPSSPEEL